jgi:hypothetical protein
LSSERLLAIKDHVTGSGESVGFKVDCRYSIQVLDCKEKKSSIMDCIHKASVKSMTKLLETAFSEAQKLSNYLQDELTQQLLEDIQNELCWQETLSRKDIDLSVLQKMAQSALTTDQKGETVEKGFGEE